MAKHKLGKAYSEYTFIRMQTEASLLEDKENTLLVKQTAEKYPFKNILPDPEEHGEKN